MRFRALLVVQVLQIYLYLKHGVMAVYKQIYLKYEALSRDLMGHGKVLVCGLGYVCNRTLST